ncbi:hypothetical protein PIB30_047474 [Stylosanthes scabra]|uniref:GDSL esterase/lipase 7 n=1 Tax=Stylosanthes scabra TaxID=79078 RepID=A0ABU6QHA4_9FABA|nr:hypothetical protein [Stylosanthes scabra]
MDSANNNFLPTSAKANYLPYAEYLGLPYPPPYLSLHGQISLSGINYASGSCGILPESGALLGKCNSLSEQINLFEWTVETNLGVKLKNRNEKSHDHLSKSIFLVAVGSNDYINNYLETKFDTSKRYRPQTFAHLLIHNLSQQFQRLYKLGARKIVTFEIGPLGCLPSISKTHLHKGNCLEETNQIVSYFNDMLPSMLNNLTFTLPHSFFVLGRINSKVYDAATNPTTYGNLVPSPLNSSFGVLVLIPSFTSSLTSLRLKDITIEKTSTRKGRSKTFGVTRSSPPTELILDIPGSTISRLRSILLQRDRQGREAAVLDRANEEVLVPLDN